jgi:alcohol dehydrogenase class IV
MGGARQQRVVLGGTAAATIPDVVASFRPRSVLLVHGRSSFASSGAAALFGGAPLAPTVESFDGFSPNPTLDEVERGAQQGRRMGPDVVVGIGGGSAMDVAKCISVLAPQSTPAGRCLYDPAEIVRPRTARLVLVPTTAGSGSEVTGFATVFANGRKRSLDHPGVRSDVAVVDPELTRGLPARAGVSASLDALCHSIESLWSARGSESSRCLARLALATATGALGLGETVRLPDPTGALTAAGIRVADGPWPTPNDPGTALSVAATLAGLAIDATRTTAGHAFAYPLTARFGVPHGAACALNMQWLLRYNADAGEADCRHPEGPRFVRRVVEEVAELIGGDGIPSAVRALRGVLARGGFGWWLGAYGVRRAGVPGLVEEALASDRAGANPRAVDPDAAGEILCRLLDPVWSRPR